MQSRNPFFADFADLMSDAFSAAQAAGEEAQAVFRAQAEKVAANMDLVTRDELDAIKAQIEAQREEIAALKAALEAQSAKPAKASTTRKSAPKATDK
ncbi:accessory factor UbiK family protein [Woodsholea maritima]|uniref:accessory factor UbiK family protein n=1 Tax=Woodsholea maritima TaxID=240237 RepID=UPI000381670F|nr:accessory factor UbiK family protein [Woodsholea maritima]